MPELASPAAVAPPPAPGPRTVRPRTLRGVRVLLTAGAALLAIAAVRGAWTQWGPGHATAAQPLSELALPALPEPPPAFIQTQGARPVVRIFRPDQRMLNEVDSVQQKGATSTQTGLP